MLARIPPQLKRTSKSAPILCFAAITLLLVSISVLIIPQSIPFLPKAWTDRTSSSYDPYPPLDHPDLDERYRPEFPSLRLPTVLDNPAPHLRLLAERIHTLLSRPGFDASFSEGNTANCPLRLSDGLVNPDQYRAEIGHWDRVDAKEIAQRRADVVRWLVRRIGNGEEVVEGGQSGKGRGIVFTGGNRDTALRLISVLKQLKRLKTRLPIEVFHYPDELKNETQRAEIEALGASIRQIQGVGKEQWAWKNWQIKSLAIVQSSFREVLYLDSDNTPLRDPSHLFTSEPYLLHSRRAVFWPDNSKDHPRNAIWRIVGKPCTLDSWTFESGQIVIDKAGNGGLNLAALLIAAGMQEERGFWYHMCAGDKDTFRWAFEMLGLEYGESLRWMGAVGGENPFEGGRFCGHSILQYDLVKPAGFVREPPLFVHSNLLKMLNGTGLSRGNLFTHIKRISDDHAHSPILNHAWSTMTQRPGRGGCLDLD